MKGFGVQDISQDFWGTKDAKRLRKQRLINIDGHAILKQNAYDLNQVGVVFMVCLTNTSASCGNDGLSMELPCGRCAMALP